MNGESKENAILESLKVKELDGETVRKCGKIFLVAEKDSCRHFAAVEDHRTAVATGHDLIESAGEFHPGSACRVAGG